MRTQVEQPIQLYGLAALLCMLLSSTGLAEDDASPDRDDTKPGKDRATTLVQRLAQSDRKLDPFGLSMNPSVVASLDIAAPALEVSEPDAALPKSSLEEALEQLTITGVIPHRKMVIIGSRSLREGEQFIIEKDTFLFNLKLSKVALEGITVTDLDSRESAFLPLGIAPSIAKGGPKFSPDQFQPEGSVLTIK